MGLEQATVNEIVEKAVHHRWGVPEFQRGFVWTPQKVRDLIDSLWRGYPVGSFLTWYSEDYGETRTAQDAAGPAAWIVDGQQRTTALCVLVGRKPYWWMGNWEDACQRYDVRFNVLADDDPFFSLPTAAMRGQAGISWVPVRCILAADDDRLSELTQRLIQDLALKMSRFGGLYAKLDSVRKVRDTVIPVVTATLDLEDVTEIFSRLNSAGTKVTEADIALALAASQNPGWAREHFLPFVQQLDEAGYELDPNIVFRSCVGIGLGRARLRDVPRAYWRSGDLPEVWARAQIAWKTVIKYIQERGILSTEILPTKNALIPLAILADRYSHIFSTPRPFLWLLHATRAGRYSGSALTTLEADLQGISKAGSGEAAIEAMRVSLPDWEPFAPEDFMQDYRDRVLRLVLYLVMYTQGARDWGKHRERLGFHGTELLERFSPDWHHIFPRAYLRSQNVPDQLWDLFANIAVIAPSTNIRFGAKNPMGYLQRYNVDDELLAEQLVPTNRQLLTIDHYEDFLHVRAKALAEAADTYIAQLASPGAISG